MMSFWLHDRLRCGRGIIANILAAIVQIHMPVVIIKNQL